jgi:hypothetical protein
MVTVQVPVEPIVLWMFQVAGVLRVIPASLSAGGGPEPEPEARPRLRVQVPGPVHGPSRPGLGTVLNGSCQPRSLQVALLGPLITSMGLQR